MERLIKAKEEPGRVAIHWLGQGGFAFKAHGGDVIVVHPYLSDSVNSDGNAARLVAIPVRPKDVRLDYLHDHLDHTDPQMAPSIAQNNPDAIIVCPPSSARHLAKLGVPGAQMRTAMPGQSLDFVAHVAHVAHVAPAEHTEDSVGFVFEFSGVGGGVRAGRATGADQRALGQHGRRAGREADGGDRAARSHPHALRDVRREHCRPERLPGAAGSRHRTRIRHHAGSDEAQPVPHFLPPQTAQGKYGHKKARAAPEWAAVDCPLA